MILFKIFQVFQINKINIEQYLKLHYHPDKFTLKSDATTQTDYTTIRPKPFPRNLSNRLRTPFEKKDLVQYWPSDDNDSTDDELQKDPPEVLINENSPDKTYTYVSFSSESRLLQHNISCLDWTPPYCHLKKPQHRPYGQFAMTTPKEDSTPFQDDIINSSRLTHHRLFRADFTIDPAIPTSKKIQQDDNMNMTNK